MNNVLTILTFIIFLASAFILGMVVQGNRDLARLTYYRDQAIMWQQAAANCPVTIRKY